MVRKSWSAFLVFRAVAIPPCIREAPAHPDAGAADDDGLRLTCGSGDDRQLNDLPDPIWSALDRFNLGSTAPSAVMLMRFAFAIQ